MENTIERFYNDIQNIEENITEKTVLIYLIEDYVVKSIKKDKIFVKDNIFKKEDIKKFINSCLKEINNNDDSNDNTHDDEKFKLDYFFKFYFNETLFNINNLNDNYSIEQIKKLNDIYFNSSKLNFLDTIVFIFSKKNTFYILNKNVNKKNTSYKKKSK